MLSAILATLTLGALDVEPKVVSASLFKNGYAVVFREFEVRGGEATLTRIPQSSLGTFWMWASDGVKIKEVVNTTVESQSTQDLASLDEILSANIGKELRFSVRSDSGKYEEIVAKLISASGSIIVLQAADTQVLPKAAVYGVRAATGTLVYQRTITSTNRVLRVKTTGAGKVTMVGLERGLTWAPSYALDISDPKKLSLVAKSTVLNDLAKLDNIEARFVTGFPNIPWTQFLEPLLSGQSIDQFTGMLGSIIDRDAAKQLGRREMMSQNMAPAADFGGSFETSPMDGIQAEDLFFYRQPGVTLKPGDRAMYILFSALSDYAHLYTVELPDAVQENVRYVPQDQVPNDVWHGIKFTNTSGQPLATAPLSVVKDGQILGQDTLKYTSKGGDALVKMNKALDIRADQTEEESARERIALKLPNGVAYDLVTLKGRISLRNSKAEAVDMKITKDLTGDIVSTTGTPKVTATAKGLRQMNTANRLEWTPTLKAGEKMELSYVYKLYVRSEGY